VHKPVDNCTQLRITTAVLWTAKKLSINLFRPLAPPLAERVEMLSPPEAGTGPGGNSGDAGGAGKPVTRAGARPWRSASGAGRAGKLVTVAWLAVQGPLHPIHGGGLVLLCPCGIPPLHATRRQTLSTARNCAGLLLTGNSVRWRGMPLWVPSRRRDRSYRAGREAGCGDAEPPSAAAARVHR
jgi:hypothetical protein